MSKSPMFKKIEKMIAKDEEKKIQEERIMLGPGDQSKRKSPSRVPKKSLRAIVKDDSEEQKEFRKFAKEMKDVMFQIRKDSLTKKIEDFGKSHSERMRTLVYRMMYSLNKENISKFFKMVGQDKKEDVYKLFDKFVQDLDDPVQKERAEQGMVDADEVIEEEDADRLVEKRIERMNENVANSKKFGTTKLINLEGEEIEIEDSRPSVVAPKVYFESECLKEYRLRIWIPGYITTYLTAPIGSDLEEEFIHKDNPVKDQEGRVFYRANKKFNILLCGNEAYRNTQKDDLFTAFDNEGNPHTFVIGYQTSSGFTIQDEKMYSLEKEYFNRKTRNLSENVEKLLLQGIDNEQLKNNVIRVMNVMLSEILKKSLASVEPKGIEVPDLEIESEEFQTLANVILNKDRVKTVGELVTEYTNILVALDPNLFGRYAETVRSRLKEGIIKLDKIPYMTMDSIYEDVMKNPTVSLDEKKIFNINGGAVIIQQTRLNAAIIYKLLHEDVEGDIDIQDIPVDIIKGYRPISTICVGRDDIPDKPEYLISYYYDPEDNVLYCFDSLVIYDRISSGNIDNPKTGKMFSPDFIWETLKIDIDALRKVYLSEIYKEPEGKWDDFEDVLDEMQPLQHKEEVTQGPYLDALYQSISDLEETFYASAEISDNSKCEYCENHIKNLKFKSIIHGDDSRVIQFCNTECFSDWKEPKVQRK